MINMKASRLMPVHIAQMLHALGKLGSQEECDEADWPLASMWVVKASHNILKTVHFE